MAATCVHLAMVRIYVSNQLFEELHGLVMRFHWKLAKSTFGLKVAVGVQGEGLMEMYTFARQFRVCNGLYPVLQRGAK